MINTITKTLKFEKKSILGLLRVKKQSVTFTFDQQAIWLFCHHHGFVGAKMKLNEVEKIAKQDMSSFITEMMYWAHVSACAWSFKKPVCYSGPDEDVYNKEAHQISKSRFFAAVGRLGKDDAADIINCFNNSQILGVKNDIYKKKVKRKRRQK